jgi:hypothetical protein
MLLARALDVLATALLTVTLGWILLAGPLAWILRDGLGPDSARTHGLDALAAWTTAFGYGPLALALGVVSLLVDQAARTAGRRARA